MKPDSISSVSGHKHGQKVETPRVYFDGNAEPTDIKTRESHHTTLTVDIGRGHLAHVELDGDAKKNAFKVHLADIGKASAPRPMTKDELTELEGCLTRFLDKPTSNNPENRKKYMKYTDFMFSVRASLGLKCM